MFYSIAFDVECSHDHPDEAIKGELRSNIWLAFNDVRVMLDADVTNMQALLILATHTSELMTPSLCWTLVTKACMMLQALGLTHRHIDCPIREQRSILFWRLNVFDKAMALTMARPPVFHRDTVQQMALPSVDQLLHPTSEGRPSLFNAQFMYQTLLLSQVMGDIWHCVYGMEASSGSAIIMAKKRLEAWNTQATEVSANSCSEVLPDSLPRGRSLVQPPLQRNRSYQQNMLVHSIMAFRLYNSTIDSC